MNHLDNKYMCPCCGRLGVLEHDEIIAKHRVMFPVNSHGVCMVVGHTREEAVALIPVYRAFMGWSEQDDFQSRNWGKHG